MENGKGPVPGPITIIVNKRASTSNSPNMSDSDLDLSSINSDGKKSEVEDEGFSDYEIKSSPNLIVDDEDDDIALPEEDDLEEAYDSRKSSGIKLRLKNKGSDSERRKRPRSQTDTDSLYEELPYPEDDLGPQEDLEEYYSSSATPDITKMTERQRRKYLEKNEEAESDVTDASSTSKQFLSLKEVSLRKKKLLTEEQQQIRRMELARRRKNLNEKKLEEEKRDTINKLLKKRAKKARDLKSLKKEEEDLEAQRSRIKPRRPMISHPALIRWVNDKSGSRLGLNVD